MSRFLVVVADTPEAIATFAETSGGTVLPYNVPSVDTQGRTVAVVHFEDDEAAITASLIVGATAFGAEWAAREHARFKASRDERTWDTADALEKIV